MNFCIDGKTHKFIHLRYIDRDESKDKSEELSCIRYDKFYCEKCLLMVLKCKSIEEERDDL